MDTDDRAVETAEENQAGIEGCVEVFHDVEDVLYGQGKPVVHRLRCLDDHFQRPPLGGAALTAGPALQGFLKPVHELHGRRALFRRKHTDALLRSSLQLDQLRSELTAKRQVEQALDEARRENARLRGRLEVLEPLAATLAASAHREAGGKVKPGKQGSLGLPAMAAPPDS